MNHDASSCERMYAATRRVLGEEAWARVQETLARKGTLPEALPELLAELDSVSPQWVSELAAVERARWQVECVAQNTAGIVEELTLNPSLQLIPSSWRGLPEIFYGREVEPLQEATHILVWALPARHGDEGNPVVRVAEAASEDLLALKIVAEDIPLEDVAREAQAPVASVKALLQRAVDKGLLLAPPSRLVREESSHPRPAPGDELRLPESVFVCDSFTLQWHITQRCDLHCKHCYDRSEREDVSLEQGLRVLDDLADFCDSRNVQGQASFTGGNPLLHSNFLDFYSAAVDRGLAVALLANPCSAVLLDAMLDIAMPTYFQVSLEGMEEHNDSIRGPGHFRRTMAFLELLADRGVESQVMLTLTRDNQDQVIPLAQKLEGVVGSFSFNRLAPVGEGAALACADVPGYAGFLREYLDAAKGSAHFGIKDNLFNTVLDDQQGLFGGCTGYGCGAAFNFLAVLSDGAAQACRKMVSPVGNVYQQGIAGVYDGEEAAAYRRGSAACAGCDIRAVCGGCMAVVKGLGLDPFTDRDPYCCYKSAPPG